MKKSAWTIRLAWISGLLGGGLRLTQLLYAFEPKTQLPHPWHPASVGLFALSLFFAATAVFLSSEIRVLWPESHSFHTPIKASMLFSAVLLAAMAALDIVALMNEFKLSKFMYILLTFFACGSIAALGLRLERLGHSTIDGFLFTVVVFWCCFTLVLDFWGHAANPVLSAYVYHMFSLISLALALYNAAGFFFGRGNVKWVLVFCSLGVYFALVTGISLLAYPFLNRSETTLQMAETEPLVLIRLVFTTVFLSALSVAVSRGVVKREGAEKIPPD